MAHQECSSSTWRAISRRACPRRLLQLPEPVAAVGGAARVVVSVAAAAWCSRATAARFTSGRATGSTRQRFPRTPLGEQARQRAALEAAAVVDAAVAAARRQQQPNRAG